MHFRKITSLALALAPLSMAGACPVKGGTQVAPVGQAPPPAQVQQPVQSSPTQPEQQTKPKSKKEHKHKEKKPKEKKPQDEPQQSTPAVGTSAGAAAGAVAAGSDPVPGADSDAVPAKAPVPGADSDAVPAKAPVPGADSDAVPAKAPVPGADSDAVPAKAPVPGADSDAVPAAAPAAAAPAAAAAKSEKFVGMGTEYGLDYPCTEYDCWQHGSCSFTDYTLPAGIDGTTCVSEVIWDNGAHCGGCISVSYKGKTIKVMVTNRTDGLATHLDMPPDTWAKLTNGSKWGGVQGIEWEWIDCPISTPLKIKLHGGASRYWFAASVENAVTRTSKLEVSTDAGKTWMTTHREVFNMYTLGKQQLSSDSAWVRVTSIDGKQVVVKDVALQSGKVTAAAANY
ncbi:hypothetical protein E4U21_003616 [Claviceps maximensis]|nr:hypothetical protein E4U21_003616 [Claviceps maximensis]